jgi:hypothetical protein
MQSLPFPSISMDGIQLPNNVDLVSTTTVLPIPYPFASSQKELRKLGNISGMHFHAPQVFMPEYGVFAVTCREFKWEGRQRSVIHFWLGQAVDGNLVIGQAHFYEHTDVIRQIAVGASGTYVLILVHKGDYRGEEGYLGEGDGYLGLLHFSAAPVPHTTFRKLDSRDLPLLSCDQIVLDDSLGLVLVVDSAGKVTTISYV